MMAKRHAATEFTVGSISGPAVSTAIAAAAAVSAATGVITAAASCASRRCVLNALRLGMLLEWRFSCFLVRFAAQA